jgi:hypothetical protein
MTDDRLVQLLEEIRDLQKEHAQRYGEACAISSNR